MTNTELAQVFYDIKWISSAAFEFEKKNTKKQSLKNDPWSILLFSAPYNTSYSCNWVIFYHNKWVEINCGFIMTVA
jgi:hypothetical protein